MKKIDINNLNKMCLTNHAKKTIYGGFITYIMFSRVRFNGALYKYIHSIEVESTYVYSTVLSQQTLSHLRSRAFPNFINTTNHLKRHFQSINSNYLELPVRVCSVLNCSVFLLL